MTVPSPFDGRPADSAPSQPATDRAQPRLDVIDSEAAGVDDPSVTVRSRLPPIVA